MAGQNYIHLKGYLMEDKGTWRVQARFPDGKTHSKSTGYKVKNTPKRKAEARKKEIIEEWELELNSPKGTTAHGTFGEYVERFIMRKSISLKATTVESYRGYARSHILPALGDKPIVAVTLPVLQGFYNGLAAEHSVSSLKKYHVVVSGAMVEAVRDGVIPVNTAKYVEFPRAKKFVGSAYTPEQVARLHAEAERTGEPVHAAVILMACYGLRRSEALGLRWSDIDFKAGHLTVTNTVTQQGTVYVEEERTKTKRSHRVIDLLDVTVPYLKRLKEMQASAGIHTDKVCAWPDGREVRPDYITRALPKLMNRCGLERIRPHDLRATAVSMLGAAGASPTMIQHFLGHEDISTTMNIYTHLYDAERKQTAELLNGVLETSVFCHEIVTDGQAASGG